MKNQKRFGYYCIEKPKQTKCTPFDSHGNRDIVERVVRHNCRTAQEEALTLFKEVSEEDWEYEPSNSEKNIIVATNRQTGECDKVKVVGFFRSRQDFYHKKNGRRDFKIPVLRKTEFDIMQKLESVDNVSGYIKSLIRADIASKNK